MSLPFHALLAACLALAGPSMAAEPRAHGGPVRALAVAPDAAVVVSGSFDQSAMLWTLEPGPAQAVLRLHEGAVNAVAALGGGRFATGGEDGRIAIWRSGVSVPETVTPAHSGPIAGLSLSPDGTRLASASWDGTVRVSAPGGPDARVLSGHAGPVNAVAWLRDGRLASGGYDGTVRLWPANGTDPAVLTLPSPVAALAVVQGDEIAVGTADGQLRLVASDATLRRTADLAAGPILALAASPDGREIAAATVGRAVLLLAAGDGAIRVRMSVPGGPVWALAFGPNGSELFTGGSDGVVRRWSASTGEPAAGGSDVVPSPAIAAVRVPPGTERGAEVFRACSACHALTPDGGHRAGPTLHGVFGRRIATAPGYGFSPALKAMDIVWSAETIDRLFAIGPARYTPGTKMPEQLVATADRRELVRFLEAATRPAR